jgi:hypothetical protein
MAVTSSVPSAEISAADRAAIEHAARDYFDSWFAGDPEKMGACLHPKLVKRAIDAPDRGDSTLNEDTWQSMVEATRRGVGTKHRGTPYEVTVLDAFRNVASVKVAGGPYVDYVHVGRFGKSWRIVNALWEPTARRA